MQINVGTHGKYRKLCAWEIKAFFLKLSDIHGPSLRRMSCELEKQREKMQRIAHSEEYDFFLHFSADNITRNISALKIQILIWKEKEPISKLLFNFNVPVKYWPKYTIYRLLLFPKPYFSFSLHLPVFNFLFFSFVFPYLPFFFSFLFFLSFSVLSSFPSFSLPVFLSFFSIISFFVSLFLFSLFYCEPNITGSISVFFFLHLLFL